MEVEVTSSEELANIFETKDIEEDEELANISETKDMEELTTKKMSSLEVLGFFLCAREKVNGKVLYDILKISYDALNDEEKAIFLDIACFFVGKDKDYATQVIGCSNLCPDIGIEVLIDMPLVMIESNKLRMHHLIKKYVSKLSTKNPLKLVNAVDYIFIVVLG
ncbi:disease resistance protein RRS1 [Ziziphus jujuba]|uniref:Disease resistance protein RRS1 n=1 Tax=Ziziphus jujuba TaxID=326968 RepID=A0A6P4ADJ0_ZIZJJ|nr:disease resistance protein RRS1 [Ziziphus jujuba]